MVTLAAAAHAADANGEDGHPQEKAEVPAVPVGQPAEEDEEGGVDDRVAVEDP